MSYFLANNNSQSPNVHGKIRSDAERKAQVRRIESDLAILSSDRMKLLRQKTDRELLLRKLKDQLRRVQVEIEATEVQTKKDATSMMMLEEEIRLTKKKFLSL